MGETDGLLRTTNNTNKLNKSLRQQPISTRSLRAAGSGSDTATPTISTMVGNNVPRSEAVGVTPASNTDSSNIPVKPKTVEDTSVSTTEKVITVNNELLESS